MNHSIALAGLLACALLVACAKQAPTPPASDTAAAPAPAAAEPKVVERSMGPADYPAKLLVLIDTAPQCQPFRTRLEEAGKTVSDEPLPVDMNQVNQIVADAYEAGCGRKRDQP
jgi:hypothetical protein